METAQVPPVAVRDPKAWVVEPADMVWAAVVELALDTPRAVKQAAPVDNPRVAVVAAGSYAAQAAASSPRNR